MKKYEFTGETKEFCGRTLRQIRALRSFVNVKKDQLGGWIESENLSHEDNCWVYGNAQVYGNARVFGNAWVYGNAHVYGNAQVYGNARVFGNAWVFGNAHVSENAYVFENAHVYGNALVSGKSKIHGFSRINHEVIDLEVEGIQRNDYRISYSGISKEGVHFIRVGCQVHSLEAWKDKTKRNEIVRSNGFNKSLIPEFLKILNEIETKYCAPKDPFKRIDENILELKKAVTDHLKTETISLISSLPVPVSVPSKGPQRDKFGRFTKKS